MTTILEEYNNSFKFYDENTIDLKLKEFTIVTVNVTKKKYVNGDIFYYVNYDYEYSENTDTVKQTNPLISLGEDGEIYDGEIIYANELTDLFIKYLLMPYEELIHYTGHTTAQRYKYSVMTSIKQFWD
jgi:hypothetical protein